MECRALLQEILGSIVQLISLAALLRDSVETITQMEENTATHSKAISRWMDRVDPPRAPCGAKNHLRQGWLEEPDKIYYIAVFLRIKKWICHFLTYKLYFSIIEWGIGERLRRQRLGVEGAGPEKMSTVEEVPSTSKGQLQGITSKGRPSL